ncbi:MAG: glycoside hydrolase family 88 protein [Bacteroidales bacterium]|nr:glycoside hydrolase family 88 protein [Bacteroidales bacterium]MCF8392182.1 glycoside hydrolase family 88 protein [Bacteroidales bacterium]
MNAMRKISFFIVLIFLTVTCDNSKPATQIKNENDISVVSEEVSKKLKQSINEYQGMTENPRNIDENGEVNFVPSRDWCSGFYPGVLWYAWELFGDSIYLEQAHNHTIILEKEKINGKTHDMGFKMYCSYGNGYRLTNDSAYRAILIESAYTLTTRFNEKIGCLRSWDHNTDKWDFPVIIDNMMNLELLFWAFKETGDSLFYKISVSHADKTIENHFRADNSSFHVVDYDPETGRVVKKNTHQGYSDESAWARGQAWGLYGYTMMYRETKDEKYLNQALKINDFLFIDKNMPEDLVPYWDFDAPGIPDEPRDASAAAIIASALYELGNYVEPDKKEMFFENADNIVYSLASDTYFCSEAETHSFLLDHSTGSKPGNSEVDTPIIYADYYFIEALIRKIDIDH